MAATLATAGTKRAEVRSASVKERIQRSIAARRGEVVLRRDLVRFGSAAQGPISGIPMARQPLGALAAETFDRLGIPWRLGAAQRRYNERLTTQVPWRTTFDTGRRRISRRLQIGKQVVNYENDLTRPAWRRQPAAAPVAASL